METQSQATARRLGMRRGEVPSTIGEPDVSGISPETIAEGVKLARQYFEADFLYKCQHQYDYGDGAPSMAFKQWAWGNTGPGYSELTPDEQEIMFQRWNIDPSCHFWQGIEKTYTSDGYNPLRWMRE